jgi:hypothetical protein
MLRLSIIAGLAAGAIALASHGVSALPLSNNALTGAASESSIVAKTQWRYCHRVREECAFRWGWRTGHYFRCVARRGCA